MPLSALTRFIFLRHGLTAPPTWKHVASGVTEQIQSMIDDGLFNDVKVIYSSAEGKPIDTARPIADALSLTIARHRLIDELGICPSMLDSRISLLYDD
jgi:broad specificity phosphatase PhoE